MGVMSWLHSKLGCAAHTENRADTAIDLAGEVAKTARSLQKQLEPYSQTNDPFHAVFTKHILAADHEHRVEFEETPRAKP